MGMTTQFLHNYPECKIIVKLNQKKLAIVRCQNISNIMNTTIHFHQLCMVDKGKLMHKFQKVSFRMLLIVCLNLDGWSWYSCLLTFSSSLLDPIFQEMWLGSSAGITAGHSMALMDNFDRVDDKWDFLILCCLKYLTCFYHFMLSILNALKGLHFGFLIISVSS